MIKVAAKNRFSQKLTHKSKKNQNKVHQNETNLGIFVNGKNFNNFIDPSSSQKSCQNDKETVNNPHIRNSASNFSKISDQSDLKQIKHRKNLSMKSPIRMSKLYLNRNSHTVEFQKSSNEGLDTIKIHSSKIQQNSKCGRKSKTQQTNRVSARSSAVKKISSFLKKSENKKSSVLTKKVSIFKQDFTNVVNQSEHYEEFLKQPSLQQKRKSKEIAKELYKYCEKQNRFLLTECPSKSYFQRQSFVKFQDDSKNTLKRKSRVSKDYLFVKSPKEFRMSTNQRQSVKNDVQDGTQLFKSFAEDSSKQNEVQQKHRRSSETQEIDQNSQENFSKKQEEMLKAQKDRIVHQMKEKQKTQQLFRKLLRELESQKEMQKIQKQSQNFYEDLRVKMLKKYDMMMKDYRLDDKEKDKISLLIEGCNLEKHRRVSNFGTEKIDISQRRRPDTAKAIRQASKDIYLLNYVDKKRNSLRTRPSSCNPKINRKNSNVRSFDQSSCFMPEFTTKNQKLHNNRCNSNIFSNDQSKSEFDEFFSITNPDIKTVSMIQNDIEVKDEIIPSKNQLSSSPSNLTLLKKKSNKKLIQQKSILSTKFNILMDICDGQSVEHIQTKKKMKVFQYYCSKVDNGFQKITQKINNFVSNF